MGSIVTQNPSTMHLLMGNEAIARGAIEAGVQLVASYPGTPSSEITEVLLEASKELGFYAEWSINEKIGFEVAAGASLVGARTLTVMKNAGLNVAMDTFMTLPYGGIKGGMVVVVADDPDAHYSSTEQDTRIAAEYAEIPCFEPEDQQEAKEMTKEAFRISETTKLPVFLRSVSRLSHASGDVVFGDCEMRDPVFGFNKHFEIPYRWNVYGPPGAINKHIWLHKEALPKAKLEAEKSTFNIQHKPSSAKKGIIASGLGAAYAKEAVAALGLENDIAFLKLGFINPLPADLITRFCDGLSDVLFIEEGDPVIEKNVRALLSDRNLSCAVNGKMYDGLLDPFGELNADIVIRALSTFNGIALSEDPENTLRESLQELIIPRSSTLCAGCSHLGTYSALRSALETLPRDQIHIINGDIGCYEQGGYGVYSKKDKANEENAKRYPLRSPYEMLDTIYVMGSGISMAHGQDRVGYPDGKLIAVCGDSTFLHAILPALVNAVYNESDITLIIMDNSWTCMTGHQPNPCTGQVTLGVPTNTFDIPAVVRAFGVKTCPTVNAYNQEETTAALIEAINYDGPSVVHVTGECQLQIQRRARTKDVRTNVDRELCIGCRRCIEIGCPALEFDSVSRKAGIDKSLCVDCGLCSQICPYDAISERK